MFIDFLGWHVMVVRNPIFETKMLFLKTKPNYYFFKTDLCLCGSEDEPESVSELPNLPAFAVSYSCHSQPSTSRPQA